MMKTHKTIIMCICSVFSLVCTSTMALEFGQMGNISAGVGSAGVALKNSQWALYYNPALLAMNKKSGFAYSFGASYKTNIAQATSIDIDNLQAMPDKFSALFEGGGGTGGGGLQGTVGNVFGNMVGAADPSNPTSDELNTYLTNKGTEFGITITGGTNNTEDILAQLQKNPEVFDSIKGDLQSAIGQTTEQNPQDSESLGLLGSIVDNLNGENISGLIEASSNGTTDVNTLLDTIGPITLSAGTDPSLRRVLQDVNTINELLQNNDFSLSTQNGIVLNIGSSKKRGTISFGIMPSAYASATAKLDPSHNQIIIQNGSDYMGVDFSNGGITIQKSDGTNYNNSSILSSNANHTLNATSIAIVEIPIGYGHLFETKLGDIAVGLAAKYIFGTGYGYTKEGNYENIFQNFSFTFGNIPQTHTFGIDLGLAYAPRVAKNLTLGLVAKNLNMPKIVTDTATSAPTRLNTQIRAGVSYGWLNDKIVFAADLDLLPNDTISLSRPKSQIAGGGLLLDFKYVDLRVGAMYDFRSQSDEGMILTGGINILGFLDIAVQSNFHMTTNNQLGIPIPSYLLVKVGGGFSW